MEKFKIELGDMRDTINRTIRFKGENYDRIMELSAATGASFNRIVNQCVEYALANYEGDDGQ